ncbi:MAG: diguanylate cyclase/phosphodiesterase & domain with sensor(s) [Modestobacter sp.]|jgi:diguanylate cyclase (GGDEF)-like protein|nr:diguanylate cyclase/phosphodiesterase & domain with sensor(s) [Modestobacter sp.]
MTRTDGIYRAARHRARLSRETPLVLGVMATLLALAAALGHPFVGSDAPSASLTLPWWAMAVAFAATEANVLHLQVRRQARSVSLSELPVVLGLFFAAPRDLWIGWLVGSVAVFIFRRRTSLLKVSFNLVLVTAETTVAVAVFHTAVSLADGNGPALWLGAYTAAFALDALGVVAIGVVIAVYDGGFRLAALLRQAVTGNPAGPIVVTVALVAVTCWTAVADSIWLFVVLGALLIRAYRVYASLSDRHRNLERLHRFSRAVGGAAQIDQVMGTVLGEARELLRSERAEVVVLTPGGGLARVRIGADGRLSRTEAPPGPEDDCLRGVMEGGVPLLMPRGTRDASARCWLSARAFQEAIAVPLRGREGITGVLIVADRLGDVRTYDREDVRVLETVANHAGVALQNSQLIERLRHEAMYDSLTGLPNRACFQRGLDAALDEVQAGLACGAAVMILDLDEFKEVNDSLGHQQGDLLLVEVGRRLTTAVGRAGTVVRLGGDEFAVLLPDTADEKWALRVAGRALQALEQPVVLDGLEIEVSGSIGVALAPAHGNDAVALLKRADAAMHDAKSSARRLRLYEPDLDTTSPRRLTLVSELRAALHNDGIQVHVQPQARLGSGAVVGVEALVRWQHPDLGWVPPDEFIPVAERSGLIGPLTSQVLDASLAACAQWRAAGHDLGIAVNLSTRSLQDAALVEEVARLLRRHGVPAALLTLEVTEGSVMADPTRAVVLLHQLRDLGVRLSVDDFGTGYSSLSYLKRLPVHEVKIDRSFVTGLREHGEDVAIVRAIVDLGRHLGLEVVAEGVEDQATWDLLGSMGCDLVQGWHLARPMPTGELLPWLAIREKIATRGGLRAV